jgi:hypothetical protein
MSFTGVKGRCLGRKRGNALSDRVGVDEVPAVSVIRPLTFGRLCERSLILTIKPTFFAFSGVFAQE